MNHQPESQPPRDVSQSQQVRDLKWAIMSPSLITDSREQILMPGLTDELHVNAQDLADYLVSYSRFRVGQYFEGLVLYWLERICKRNIIARHQQVFEDNRTVGEIDILFEDEDGVLTHWEIAVKFYLYFPETNAIGSHFVGPNVKDSFEKKMRRLFEHQLPLSQTHYPEVARRQAFVKGMIFYHPECELPTQLPERLSPTHSRGTWLHISELSWLKNQNEIRVFRVLEKPHWLSPEVSNTQDENLKSFEEFKRQLETHFLNSERPLLVSVLTCQQEMCHEIDRVFIVSDAWSLVQ